MNDQDKSLNFYKAAARDERPDFVPSKIVLKRRICGDGPYRSRFVDIGEHDCQSNQWGALSVRANDGEMLGIKIGECDVIAWRTND